MDKEKKELWYLIHYSKTIGHVEIVKFDNNDKNNIEDTMKRYLIHDQYCFLYLIKGKECRIIRDVKIILNL